jgi:hypothetical protein
MAFFIADGWCVCNVTKKDVGEEAFLLEVVESGNERRYGRGDKVIVSETAVTLIKDQSLGDKELAAVKLDSIIGKVT